MQRHASQRASYLMRSSAPPPGMRDEMTRKLTDTSKVMYIHGHHVYVCVFGFVSKCLCIPASADAGVHTCCMLLAQDLGISQSQITQHHEVSHFSIFLPNQKQRKHLLARTCSVYIGSLINRRNVICFNRSEAHVSRAATAWLTRSGTARQLHLVCSTMGRRAAKCLCMTSTGRNGLPSSCGSSSVGMMSLCVLPRSKTGFRILVGRA